MATRKAVSTIVAQRLAEAVNALQAVPMVDSDSKERLVLVVEFDSMQDRSTLDEIIDKARESGYPVIADYYRVSPARESLV